MTSVSAPLAQNKGYSIPDVGFSVVSDSARRQQIVFDQQNGKATGTCIRENSKRLVELWNKGHDECVMMFLHIMMDKRMAKANGLKREKISHFVIYSPKNNMLIDVSNGLMKMTNKDFYFQANDIRKTRTFNQTAVKRTILLNLKKQGFMPVASDVLVAWCNQIHPDYIQ